MKRITIIIDVTSDLELKEKLQKKANADNRTLADYCRIKLKEIVEAK